MPRSVPAIALLVLAALVARADDPPKSGGQVQMLLAKIDGDKLVTTSTSQLTRSVTVRERGGDGMKTIQVTETNTTTLSRELKLLRATDTNDKDISTDDLKAKLKETTPVVFLTTPLDLDWKKKFKSGTVFLEYTEPVKDEKKAETKAEAKK